MSAVETRTVIAESLDAYPGFNRFALDYVRDGAAARRFLCRSDLATVSAPRQPRGSDELASALIRTNREWGNDVSSSVRAWREGSSVAIIAGQQVGFAGGPLYTLVKIASLLKMRRQFRERGVDATIFFWLATEDHDFDEVATLAIWTRDGIRTIRASERPPRQRPVGAARVPESLRLQFREVAGTLTPDSWLQPELTMRDSFALLLTEALRGEEIVLVDSLLPELRGAAMNVVSEIITRHAELQTAIAARSLDVTAAGFTPQVLPSETGEYSLLFLIAENGERQPIRFVNGNAVAGGNEYGHEQLLEMLRREPERFSTGALTRPVIQDAVLRPEVFVGGPAEVAYFAQNAPLYDLLGVAPARVALRGHLLVAPERFLTVMRTEKIAPGELFDGADAIVNRRQNDKVEELNRKIDSAERELGEKLEEIERFIETDDRTIARSAARSRRRVMHHLTRLRTRGAAALARRDRERYQAITRLLDTLAPARVPQDRTVGWVTFWLQRGVSLIERVVDEVEPDTDRWKVVGI